MTSKNRSLSRRGFLRVAAAGLGGAGVLGAWRAAWSDVMPGCAALLRQLWVNPRGHEGAVVE